MIPVLCDVCKLTFCALGSGPARSADALPTGRVADAIVTAATGLVTSFPIETRRARCQERIKLNHYLFMNSADQKWKFQGAVSDTGRSMGNIQLGLSHVRLRRVFPNETEHVFVPLHTEDPKYKLPELWFCMFVTTLEWFGILTLRGAAVTHSGCRTDRSTQQDRSKPRWRGHSSHRSDTNTSADSRAQRNPEDMLKHTSVKTAYI